MRRWWSGWIVVMLLAGGCSSSEKIYDASELDEPPSLGVDSLVVTAEGLVTDTTEGDYVVLGGELPPAPPPRRYDLLHTELDLRVEFGREAVTGTAAHRLTPLQDDLGELTLDADDLAIHQVLLRRGTEAPDTLRFTYDRATLVAFPPEPLAAEDTVELAITYTARPMRDAAPRGMVFVDAAGTDPSEPTQVWTLGQPSDNRVWMPIWDHPNERATFDLILTVPDSLDTVANGRLVEQTRPEAGWRRDVWSLDRPHAPYLTAFAAGEFEATEARYVRSDGSSVPLVYYVEPEVAEHVATIFGETPEMMRVFEERTGMRYPWSVYKQVPVRDFTAGGMEHTTATFLADEVQVDPRALLDYQPRALLAHELAHQWFGNALTPLNWAYLPLSEGFATYFEAVFAEAVDGRDGLQRHNLLDRAAYFAEAADVRRPVIWYGFDDPNELFDAHAYQKAGQVLHLLRAELGDEAFWAGVRRYARLNQGQSVSPADLRAAMEDASGRDLGFFFEQWFNQPGHPELMVEQSYRDDLGLYEVRVQQVQDTTRQPVFDVPVNLELNFSDRSPYRERVRVQTADTTFRIGVAGTLTYARFDEGDHLLAEIEVEKPVEEWVAQARLDDELAGRFDAVTALAELEPTTEIGAALLSRARRDASALVRQHAVEALAPYRDSTDVIEGLERLALHDPAAPVRQAALRLLSGRPASELRPVIEEALRDRSYLTVAQAMALAAARLPEDVPALLRPFEGQTSWAGILEAGLIEAYGVLDDPGGYDYIEAQTAPERPETVRAVATATAARLALRPGADRARWVRVLTERLDDPEVPVRIAAVQGLSDAGAAEARPALEARLAVEPVADVRTLIRQSLDALSSDR